MSILTLGPRVYRQDMKWSLVPENKIDTVTFKPYVNALTETTEIATVSVTQVGIEHEDGEIKTTLPIANSVPFSKWHTMSNTQYGLLIDWHYAKARVEAVIAKGTARFELNAPLTSAPTVKLSFRGNSDVIARKSGTYDNFPTVEQLNDPTFDLRTWIYQHRTNTSEAILSNFSGKSFDLNPWVSEVTSYVSESRDAELADPSTIKTTWVDTVLHPNNGFADYSNWIEVVSDAASHTPTRAVPASWDPTVERAPLGSLTLPIRNARYDITTSVRKLNDYTYEVDFKVPVRYTYLAASNYGGVLGSMNDLDNYAFNDVVSHVDVTLVAQPISEETIDMGYSEREGSHALTTDLSNAYPFNFSQNEFITLNTYWGFIDWTIYAPIYIFSQYRQGKYIVECTVSSRWAFQNNVHIGTQCQVQLQNGTLIGRGDQPCTFEVKNITKQFRDSDFMYRLKLLETT